MKTKEMTPAQLREYSGEHLLYELKMFWWAAAALDYLDGRMRDAVLESFVLHLRNLIDFFCLPRDGNDSVIAEDFLENPVEWKGSDSMTTSTVLPDAKFRANKELAHLTTERRDKGSDEKSWKTIPQSVKEIQELATTFVRNAAQTKLDPKVRTFVNSIVTQRVTVVVSGKPSPSTNS